MKAAVFNGVANIEIKELEIPQPAKDEILLKVEGCGVCGTDAHIFSGEIDNAVPPVILGHEITGTVEKIGKEVSSINEGQEIVVDPFIYCGMCEFCKSGNRGLCSNESFLGYTRAGGFCQYTVVPETNSYPIPQKLSYPDRIICETLSTVLAGFDRLRPKPGSTYLILGAGTVGLLWNQVIRNSLPGVIIQSEIVNKRMECAASLGADIVISPDEEDILESVLKNFPLGIDYIIDATGVTSAIEQALPLLKKGGTFLSFGVCPANERLSLSLNWFYKNQITIITSRRPPRHNIQNAIKILETGSIDTKTLVTSRRPLEEIEKAFKDFEGSRNSEIKMAIDPWH
ncbi:MAG: alcohol dehydrogenase catalytic domain-containing protein [Spirochaetota bacterium]|nr:MAG: alcohol dehydrogenase catalytic domain-containing protein [Spirochaetota bacterium]